MEGTPKAASGKWVDLDTFCGIIQQADLLVKEDLWNVN